MPYGEDIRYVNPRVTFDGVNWWVSVGVGYPDNTETPTSEGVGIDLGISELAVCSDSRRYKNINKTKTVKQLEKRKRRLQRKVSNKYESNKIKMKGGEVRYKKTNNIIKLENQLRRLNQRLTNIRQNHSHEVTTEITRRKPSFIVVEDLKVRQVVLMTDETEKTIKFYEKNGLVNASEHSTVTFIREL